LLGVPVLFLAWMRYDESAEPLWTLLQDEDRQVSDDAPFSGAWSDRDKHARDLSDIDQGSSEADQGASDTDQGASDVDQSASERDQRASDRDQVAADRDQAESDLTHAASWAESRRTRAHSTIERDIATHARLESSRVRDQVAELRDRAAEERDAAADARDQLAAALDGELEALEHGDVTLVDGPEAVLADALAARRLAGRSRSRAAIARRTAAHDRQAARADRQHAALDREMANAEIALEGRDYLTGMLRRRAGLAALTRELARARRLQQPLLVAFADVDELKAVNDEHGHAAGDEILRAAAQALAGMMRQYDVVIRYGGDEFVCVLCDQVASNVESRFDVVIAEFAASHGKRLSVGLAEAGPDELPEELIARADAAMIAARQDRRSRS
jgi:diguanylate cyclase (GGDEF)-like protein